MRGKAERDPRRERIGIRDQADRSDNAASRALVVLRFLLNTTDETDRIWLNPTTPCYLTNNSRSAETGEIFGLTGLSQRLEKRSRLQLRRIEVKRSVCSLIARSVGRRSIELAP